MTTPSAEDVAREACAALSADFVEPLGQGAFKSAFLARREGRSVALKLAPVTPASKARIARECEAQRDCNHLAIATLCEAFEFTHGSGSYWIWIEEHLGAGTLEKRRGSAIFSPAVVSSLGATLVGALDHLRARNLVHRDIKPANIIFRSDAEPVLTDFGIVRALDLPTLTQHFLPHGPGTPAYAAPEQLNNEIQLIDWRTDQFGLAIVLGECALGHHPFSPGKDVYQAVARMAAHEALPAESSDMLHRTGLGWLTKALSPWPVARYRTPNAMLAAIIGGAL